MKEINLYLTYNAWYNEQPDAVIKGIVVEKNKDFIEILDDSQYTQIIMLNKLFALTYR